MSSTNFSINYFTMQKGPGSWILLPPGPNLVAVILILISDMRTDMLKSYSPSIY